jgi:hypothetical protein
MSWFSVIFTAYYNYDEKSANLLHFQLARQINFFPWFALWSSLAAVAATLQKIDLARKKFIYLARLTFFYLAF